MSTRVTLDLPVSRVKVHPKNPRRTSVADDQLVASVAESGITTPLLVAVDLSKHTAADVLAHATGVRALPAGQHVHVIALDGHRRRDAAKRAKLKTVPVVINLDLTTEVDQIKAMILANEHREDLSPVEIAESYQGLLDLGLKQADVARVMGRRPREVSAQLKVLKLADTTQAKVHTGVLTLDDAAGLLEFAGDTDTTRRLEESAESGADFRYQLQRARARRDELQRVAVEVAEHEQAGVPRVEVAVFEKAGWSSMRPVAQFPGVNSDNPPVHDGCLGYVQHPVTEHAVGRVFLVCTDVAKHQADRDTAVTALDAARAARIEEQRAAAEQRRADEAAATKVRHDLLRELASQDLKLTDGLVQVLRATLPAVIDFLDEYGPLEVFEDLLDLDDGARVSRRPYGPARDTALVDQLASYATLGKPALGRHLVLALVAVADWVFAGGMEPDDLVRAQTAPYVDLLEAHGYEFAGPDAENRDQARGVLLADDDQADGPAAGES